MTSRAIYSDPAWPLPDTR